MNIRSLFNLTKRINSHILNLPPKKNFDLLDIKPILYKYTGNDWNNYISRNNNYNLNNDVNNRYKLNFVSPTNFNNYLKIPIKFNELSNYNIHNYKKDTFSNVLCQFGTEQYKKDNFSNVLCQFGTEQYEMFLLVWHPYSYTALHNHKENGCLMKILEGNIIEQKISNEGKYPQTQELFKNDISYIHNTHGLHRIINNNSNYSYSLHIYS